MASSLRVLVIDEEPGIRDGMAFSLKRAGFVTEQARNGEEALQLLRPGAFDAVVTGSKWNLSPKGSRESSLDGLMLTCRLTSVIPGLPVLHVQAPQAVGRPIEHAHLALVVPVIVKPFSPDILVTALWRAIRGDDHLKAESWGDGLVLMTQDRAYAEHLHHARRASESWANVVIEAEAGSDGERLARLIHVAGKRKAGPWVTLRCGASDGPDALPTTAEGIADAFDRAEGGTVFLDEVDALVSAQQEWISRLLRERSERSQGRGAARNFRVIALATRNLLEETRAGRFNDELRYLLEVVPIRIPPLRERPEDLPLLAAHIAEFFTRANARPAIRLAPSFRTALTLHSWPGNARELESAVKRAVALSAGAYLSQRDLAWLLPPEALAAIPPDPVELPVRSLGDPRLPARRGEPAPPKQEPIFADPKIPVTTAPLGSFIALPLGLSLPDLERFWLLSTLAAVDGNRTRCAQQMGLALRTIRNKLNEYRAQGFSIPASTRDRDDD